MDSGHVFFDSSCQGNMFLTGKGDPLFRGLKSAMNIEEASLRRPFLSSPEEPFDEEYFDEQLPEKKRRLTPEQLNLLEKSFEAENKLEPDRKTQLAKKLGLQPRQVAVWFQNRRARWKNKQLERDYNHLKSSVESLRSDYDSLLKENEKLKAEVAALVVKLRDKQVAGEPVSGPKTDPIQVDLPGGSAIHLNVKVDDRLSTGSVGSAVVDEDGPQLVDSCDSYFLHDDYPGCVCPSVDGIQSEEDDGSDDGQNYFSDDLPVAAVAEVEHQEEGETLSWWVWS